MERMNMTKYAVAYTNADGEDLVKIEIIEANGWKQALISHSFCISNWGNGGPLLPDDLTEVKEAANGECGFEFYVKEI